MDRVEMLRNAFNLLQNDALFKQDAAQAHIELDPRPAGKINSYVALATSASPDVVQRLAEILNPQTK
jgi:hypothetical protein